MADHMTAEQLTDALLKLAEVVSLMDPADNADAKRADHLDSELRRLAARLSGIAADTWRPIETAPRDGRVAELQFANGSVTRGHWMRAVKKWNCYGLVRDESEFVRWFRVPAAPEPPHV